jgi:hypothetical protein
MGIIDRTKGDKRDIYIFQFAKGVKSNKAIERILPYAQGTMRVSWIDIKLRGACVVFDTREDMLATLQRIKASNEFMLIDQDHLESARKTYGKIVWD